MTIDMSQFYQVFFEETAEHLVSMESLLLGMDVNAPSLDELNAVFRAAHSIKGGAGTFGFTDMTEVTHVLETLLDKLRKEELTLRTEMVDVFLQAGDVLKAQLDAHQNGGEVEPSSIIDVCHKLNVLAGIEADDAVTQSESVSQNQADAAPLKHIYQIEFTPEIDTNLDNLFAELSGLGEMEITENGSQKTPPLWKLNLNTHADEAELKDSFAYFVSPDQIHISRASGSTEADGYGFYTDVEAPVEDASYGFFTEIETPPTPVEDASYGFFEPITPPVESHAVVAPVVNNSAPQAEAKNAVTPARRSTDKAAGSASADSSIRVSIDKVDQLINLVGELVITQAMLAQTASTVDPVIFENLVNGMAQLERNTRDLQESVMSIRMMPISFVFSRYPRVVRDLASKLNKLIELKTVGEDTEMDKVLIEKLADPLTHLVRNSLDHGIESPDKRIAAGKSAKGTITLRAFHQGGSIIIEVMDDGGGLHRDKILAKAKERGLPVTDSMPDQDVWQLIFAAGFSTAEVVTDVSGRGVGMDVVKRNIQEMGGQVEISSETGFGTKISIRLPLTLAILDGMSIGVGKEVFIIPLTFISESIQPAAEDIKSIAGEGQVVQVRGEYLPLIALHKLFNMKPKVSDPSKGILVLLEAEGKKIALFVDELLGQHQVVIKSLESNFRKVPHVSGATIMGDGRVAVILDVTSLIKVSQNA